MAKDFRKLRQRAIAFDEVVTIKKFKLHSLICPFAFTEAYSRFRLELREISRQAPCQVPHELVLVSKIAGSLPTGRVGRLSQEDTTQEKEYSHSAD